MAPVSTRSIMSKVWFVTGASKGFGREFVLAALERGDKVAATARNTDTLSDLVKQYGDAVLPVELDVTNRDQVFAAVKSAHETFGRIDVVINNAGYGLFGTVEEITEHQLRDQLEDEPIRRFPCHAGGPPDPPRAAPGPHHPDLDHGRHRRVPDPR